MASVTQPVELASERTGHTRLGFRRDIEGLRGIAVLVVLLYHAGVPGFDGGYVGVDVFFVLSGYLITKGLVTELRASGTIRIATFYARRFRRLLPASTLVLVVTVIGARFVATPMVADSVARDGLWAAGWLANQRFIAVGLDYLATDAVESPLLHYWSLAVEEQFYVLWPLLLLAAVKLGRGTSRTVFVTTLWTVVIVSFAWAVALSGTNATVAYLSLPTRAWELAAGGLLAVTTWQLRPGVARLAAIGGIAAIVASAVLFDAATLFPGPMAAIPVVGTAAVILAGAGGWSPAARLLNVSGLQRAGTLSYSLYLWHWPVLVLTAQWLGRELQLTEALACLVVSWGLSVASFRLVEDPLRRSKRLSARNVRSLAFGGGLVAVSLVASIVVAVTVPSLQGSGAAEDDLLAQMAAVDALIDDDGEVASATLDADFDAGLGRVLSLAVQQRVVPAGLNPSLRTAGDELPVIYDDGCVSTETTSPACIYGDVDATRSIVLLGDSHAAHWFPPVNDLARERGWQLTVLTKGGCPMLEIAIWRDGRPGGACNQWRDHALDRIAALQPDRIILANATTYDAYTDDGDPRPGEQRTNLIDGQAAITATLRTLTPDTHLTIMGASPRLDSPAPECLARNLDDTRPCTPTRDQVVDTQLINGQHTQATIDQADFINTTDLLCTDTTCPLIIGDLLVYWDTHHLTTPTSHWLRPALHHTIPH